MVRVLVLYKKSAHSLSGLQTLSVLLAIKTVKRWLILMLYFLAHFSISTHKSRCFFNNFELPCSISSIKALNRGLFSEWRLMGFESRALLDLCFRLLNFFALLFSDTFLVDLVTYLVTHCYTAKTPETVTLLTKRNTLVKLVIIISVSIFAL